MSFHVGDVPPMAKLTLMVDSSAWLATVTVPSAGVPAVSEIGAESIVVAPLSTSTVRVGVVPPDARAGSEVAGDFLPELHAIRARLGAALDD